MVTIYVYVLDTLADWELGYVTSELNSGRFFKKGAKDVSLKTVSNTKEAIKTMGGLTIVPDCTIEDMAANDTNVLSAELLLRLQILGYWITAAIQVMDRDFLRCFLLAIKDRAFTLTSLL